MGAAGDPIREVSAMMRKDMEEKPAEAERTARRMTMNSLARSTRRTGGKSVGVRRARRSK